MTNNVKKYAPLHIHSHYSTLDGYATVEEYIAAAKHLGLPGLGLSDHGNASGLYKFITQSQKEGLIPVPGIEFYLAPENPEGAKKQGPVYYGEGGKRAPKYDVSNGAYTHITVFARNNKGLSNLFKLTSLSWLPENFYFKPRIDVNMLAEYSEGLIVTTGCPSSEVNRRFLLNQDDKAYEFAGRLKSIFKDDMYIEMMDHKMPDEELERILLPKLRKMSKDLGIKMIATNDSHYAFPSDAAPHERILAVATKSNMKEKPFYKGGSRFAFSTEEYYIKSYDEMLKLYPEDIAEELLANTLELMNKCKDIKLDYDPHLRPEIDIPEGHTPATYLQEIIFEGFKTKRGHESEEIKAESVKRIREEFEVLHSNDFISYFLVVHDYIDYAHKNNIGVGAGRGCFLPGSKVKLNQGALRNIEDIKIGQKVQTHDTTYQAVEDTFIYDVENEDMISIKLSNGKEIKSTSDHLIFHKDKGFIKAEDFIVGDTVLGPKGRREKYGTESYIDGERSQQSYDYVNALKCNTEQMRSGYFTSYQQAEKQIYYTSNYELKALTILETDSTVKEFDRCMIRVPYIKPSTGLEQNYLPDFEVISKDGTLTVVEVNAEWELSDEDTAARLRQTREFLNDKGINFEIWTESTFTKLNDEWHNDIEIISIERFKYTGKVYDIQVANVHNYNVEGVTVHNSVGGSEIAYVMDISNTDPIRFNLLFERFLSPGRGSLYQIEYVSGESEEIPVSSRKRVQSADGTEKVVYIHELYPGDTVNFGEDNLVIKDVYVKQPGSAPDVDTDFHTEGREQVVQYCVDKYGADNVANIVSFGTFKAKRAFKSMCTVYNVPYAMANNASNFIPGTQGAEASLKELMDPSSPRYREGEDFRGAIDNPIFDEVVDMASALDGRISETGLHPCGVIISNQSLAGIIPTQVRQSDEKIVSQWEYPELEALGLIKMDLLGLELINTVQQTLDNIRLTNESAVNDSEIREVPDMRELISGPMDDPETFETLQQGNTVGIFQLGSPGVRELLRRARPGTFMDIATITALYRPGPMSMDSHNEWADRKNGTEDVIYIDEGLKGTVVQDILEDTEGILVFQESLMQIATEYAGMTSYESDSLRKAMGKKKMDIMMSMRPKFIDGAIEKGSTKELAETVWETMEGFAAYGFNKCAWGGTKIATTKGKFKLSEIYKMYKDKPDEKIEVYSMFEDGSIRPHTIKEVVNTGKKPVYEIRTESGKKIKITEDHRMLTTEGYGTILDGKIALGKELVADNKWGDRLSQVHKDKELSVVNNAIVNRQTELSNESQSGLKVKVLIENYLIERGVNYDTEKDLKSSIDDKVVRPDFYIDGLCLQIDVFNKGADYFKREKYGDLPFVSMTPFNYMDVIDEALMSHIENGDKITDIIAPEKTGEGIEIKSETFDIEMDDNGPSNFIADGLVSHNSHSVSYALNIYETVFLKTHYPSEFMAALIQQGFGNPDKVRAYIQEAMRMKLSIGAVDINTSQVQMASTGVNPDNEYDIVFGFSGVRQVNEVLANAIVEERNANGLYTSIADFVERISKSVPLTASPLAHLATAGAFDSFDVSRKQVAEKAKMFIDSSKLKETKGLSLFDMMGGESNNHVAEAIDVTGDEYDFNELIKLEAHTIGMFVSGHPTSRLGHIANMYQSTSLADILASGGSRETFTVLGTVTHMQSKTNKSGNRSIALMIDDGSDISATYLPKHIVNSIEKFEEMARISKAKERGVAYKMTKRSENLAEIVNDPEVIPMDPIELNEPYMFKIKTRGWGDNVKVAVNDIVKLNTAPDGSLPYEVNVPKVSMVKSINEVVKKHEDKNGAFVKLNLDSQKINSFKSSLIDTRVKLSLDFIIDMENIVGKENIVTEGI